MRIVGLVTILLGTVGCTQAQPQPEPRRTSLTYDIAYEAMEGRLKGLALFIDQASGDTWVAFRDEREAVSKEGPGSPLVACREGAIGCFKEEQRPPLLSTLPPADFLNGAFRYTARPASFWAMTCTEIEASSQEATTTSIVCPVVGLVQFAYAVNGNPTERYQLKSWAGLFAQR